MATPDTISDAMQDAGPNAGVDTIVAISTPPGRGGIGIVRLSGPDATSQASPDVVWVNNGYIQPGSNGGLDKDLPVSPTTTNYNFGKITCQRDLENFFRLWICGVPAITFSNGLSATLTCTPISGVPAINVYEAETNGGTLYLTDTNTAQSLVNETELGTVGTTTTGSGTLIFPDNFFDGSTKHLLFEGAGIGEGWFTLAIYQGTNSIMQASAFIDLHDVKDFYERAVITNNTSGVISNWSSTIETVQQASSTIGTDTNLVVFVHGINVDNWHWLDDSDTVLKRLYLAGYQGKFASVDWPCNPINFLTFLTLDENVFNNSELKAYKASTALNTYFSGLRTRFQNYRLNIFAHSQGNAVVSEAIAQGASFDNYILTQGALPASCYDVNTPTDATLAAREALNRTPEWQPMGYHGVYTNLSGNIINYYNSQDAVLNYWYDAQELFKPNGNYSYDGSNSVYSVLYTTYTVTDAQESRAEVSRSRTLAIGQQGLASGETKQGIMSATVDLHAQFGFNGTSDDEHSAQWTRPIQTSYLYYKQILLQILPTP